jgi:molybdopterin converting factor subunit 1
VPDPKVHSLLEPDTEVHSLLEPDTEVHSLLEPDTEVHSLLEPDTEVHSLLEPDTAPAVSVLYFAALRDLAGTSEESVSVSPTAGQPTVAQLVAALEERHAGLRGRLTAVRVAVNEEFVELTSLLRAGDVVALIPPVSGG